MKNIEFKVEKEKKENNQFELSIVGPKEISSKAYNLAIREIANGLNISGFRKGKAPKNVVENAVGKEYITHKAFEKIFYETIIDVTLQENIDLVDIVKVTSYDLLEDQPFSMKVLIEVKPEVKLGKYKGLKVKAKKIVYDKDKFIQNTLSRIQNNFISFAPSDKPLSEGDSVTLDFEGVFEDGSEIPGGKAENYQAIFEKTNFLPDFVDKLTGAKNNEEREIEIHFPENAGEGFASKKAKFKVKVKQIESKVLPALDGELAKKLGIESYSQLEEKILSEMEDMQTNASNVNFESALVDEIIKESQFDIPESLLNKETDSLLSEFKSYCDKAGMNWDTFKTDEKNKDLISGTKEKAKKRVSIDLVLNAIAKFENIDIPQDDIKNEIAKKVLELGEKYQYLHNDKIFQKSIKHGLLRNKAIDLLISNNEAIWEIETPEIKA